MLTPSPLDLTQFCGHGVHRSGQLQRWPSPSPSSTAWSSAPETQSHRVAVEDGLPP